MPVEFTREDIIAMKRLGIFDLSAINRKGYPTRFKKQFFLAFAGLLNPRDKYTRD